MTKNDQEIAVTEDRDAVITAIYSAKQTGLFDDDSMASVKSEKDVLALLRNAGVEPEDFSEYGTGFAVTDKALLVGVPFTILEWRFNANGKFDGFVSFAAVTKDGRKVIVNDGSSGIRKQLESVTATRHARGVPEHLHRVGLTVPAGLTRSDYTVMLPNAAGELVESEATTFYLGN